MRIPQEVYLLKTHGKRGAIPKQQRSLWETPRLELEGTQCVCVCGGGGGSQEGERKRCLCNEGSENWPFVSGKYIYTNIYFLFSKNFIKFYFRIVKITRAFPIQSERTLDLDVLVQCTGLQRHGQWQCQAASPALNSISCGMNSFINRVLIFYNTLAGRQNLTHWIEREGKLTFVLVS